MNLTVTLRTRGATVLLAALLAGCYTPLSQVPPPPPAPTPVLANPLPPPVAPRKIRDVARLPKVMLLVDERSIGTIATSEVEAMAVTKLLEEGVPVVDQDMVRANIARSQEVLRMAGDTRGAAALGTQFGADVILTGEAVAKPSARRIAESNLRTYQAAVTLRAVRTDTSAILATASEDAAVLGVDDVSGSAKALKTAGEKSLSRIVPSLLDAWEQTTGTATSGLAHVVLTVGGVDQAWKLKEVRERLRGMTDIAHNVVQSSYTSGAAVFSLDSTLPAAELSERLVLNPPDGLSYQVLDVLPGRIGLRAIAVSPRDAR